MRILLLAALLAACSPPASDTPADNAAVSTPAPTPVATTVTATPVVGDLKTFRDWTVGCDNLRRCTMASLGPDGGVSPVLTMSVARVAGPAGGFEIALDAIGDDAVAPGAVAIDGRRFAIAGDGLAGAAARAIAAAMVQGKALLVQDAQGRTIQPVSLAGAAAALRYIDAAQGRADTVTAVAATGPKPADTVPPAPAVPVIAAVAPSGTAATPTGAQLAEMRKLQGCTDNPIAPDSDVIRPEAFALGGGKTLVLMPCGVGAYNLIQSLFVIDGERVSAAKTDSPAGFDETGADSGSRVATIVNGTFEKGVLQSYAKGRGLGDCGVTQSFVWDGERLRLSEQSAMGECRGNPNYIRVWHAQVTRR
jgi:hypothetical protein